MAASLHHQAPLLLQPTTKLSCSKSVLLRRFSNSNFKFNLKPKTKTYYGKRPVRVLFAVTESDSPKSLNPDPQTLLQELAETLDLPSDYFAKLPRDLRLDLNDAAFDLSNGPVLDECGQELGDTLLNLARAWELADTATSAGLAKKLPLLESSLKDNKKSAFGKRLVSAGRRFQSMGQYGQGELGRYYWLLSTSIDCKGNDFCGEASVCHCSSYSN